MPLDLTPLDSAHRLLFNIPLQPLQGQRFQPTGFPNLGASTWTSGGQTSVLVESAQSMANRLELTIWDAAQNTPIDLAKSLSHVRVERAGAFLTDTILEAHRLNSPYLLASKDTSFKDQLKEDLGGLEVGPINRHKFAGVLLDYDIGSLLHGVFLAKSELAGGRLRVARAMSAFIEASRANIAPSGGVKNDHVAPSKSGELSFGSANEGFGNVPFARDEYVAEDITLYVNIDLAQIRGYGLGDDAVTLLITLALYKLRALLDGGLRLRTACDLAPTEPVVSAESPSGFELPRLNDLADALNKAASACASRMTQRKAVFDDEPKKSKNDGE